MPDFASVQNFLLETGAKVIDLQKYCGDDPFRPYLHKPFSHGSFTYATNGHTVLWRKRHKRQSEAFPSSPGRLP